MRTKGGGLRVSKNEIQKRDPKNKTRFGGWNLEEVPALLSSKKKLQAFEEIEGVEFKTILHSSLLQASKDNNNSSLFSSTGFEGQQETEGVEFRIILSSSLRLLSLFEGGG